MIDAENKKKDVPLNDVLKIVVDSNVWIDVYKGKAHSGDCKRIAFSSSNIKIGNQKTLTDLKDAVFKMLRKGEIDKKSLYALLASYEKRVLKCPVRDDYDIYVENHKEQLSKCKDKTDYPFLVLAHEQGASHIITSDKHLLEVGEYEGTKIVTPAMFIKEMEIRRAASVPTGKRDGFDIYADAVGADRYRVLITDSTGSLYNAKVYDAKNGGKEGKTREEIREAIPKLATYAHYKKNIYVFPLSQDKHHIVVDDLNAEKLKQFKDDGYSPACVIESSPGNYQAILTVPSAEGDAEKDREAANKLTKELNTKYGDKNLSGAKHSHRLPPFPNFKPERQRADGSYPETALQEANGGICAKAKGRLDVLHKEIQEVWANEKLARERTSRISPQRAGDPTGAYWAHARDIIQKQGVGDFSRLDGMIGMRMRVTGHTQSEICGVIASNAANLRKEHMTQGDFAHKYGSRNWQKYAEETTNHFVFGARGREQLRRAEQFEPYFMKVEGRDFREERTALDRSKGESQSKRNGGDGR